MANNTGAEVTEDEDGGVIVIASQGDVVLNFRDEERGEACDYRVDSTLLRAKARYFDRLFDPTKFGEGRTVATAVAKLKAIHETLEACPATELPRVSIDEIGRISSNVKSISKLCRDFLSILHDQNAASAGLAASNLANIAILADRFDALEVVTEYAHRIKFFQMTESKSKGKITNLPEEKARQRLLLALLLDFPQWVSTYTKRLIISGSILWGPNADSVVDHALWWDLPQGMEAELLTRRRSVLETVESIQSHFLKLYASTERQCKLGYDSSPQCDSFQLGEIVRFLGRIGYLELNGLLLGKETQPDYAGNVEHLFDQMRQCPAYQLDRHHAHCGLRARLIPLLDSLEALLRQDGKVDEIGVCGECWKSRRADYSWADAKRPIMWSKSSSFNAITTTRRVPGSRPGQCFERHMKVRDMFTASQRDWTANESGRDVFDSKITLGMRKL